MNCTIVEEIIQLRKQGISMKAISKQLDISRAKVRYHCNKNGLNGILAENPTVDNAFKMFLNNLQTNHGDKVEYVSGYIDSEKPVLIQCKECGEQFKRAAQFARKKKKVSCPCCIKLKKPIVKLKPKPKPIDKVYLLRKSILKAVVKPKTTLKEVHILKCDECNSTFGTTRKRKLCSKACNNRRDNRLKELRKRKARINGKVDYSITIEKVIQKEKNVCYLCGGQCDSTDFTIDDRGSFIVGRNYPSIEHVIAISKGGTHTWDNVKLAHHYCNSIKNDKKIVEDTGQMVLML